MTKATPYRTAAKIAWRETRASSGRFLFVILAVAAGVGALTGVRGFSRAFHTILQRDARGFMAADLTVRTFALPTAHQTEVMDRLADKGVRRTQVTETLTMASPPAGGIPLLPGCSALFQCKTAFNYEGGDHVIFVGEVQEFEHFDRPPLVFHSGRYAVAVEKAPAVTPANSEETEPDSSFSQDFLIYLLQRAHFQLFLGLRRDLERHGLSEDQWFVLSILGISDNRTVAELDQLLWYTGRRVTYELLASLTASGFARLHGSYDPHARVVLTDAGKRVVLQLVAMAKAAESDAERNLGYGETQLLKKALRAVIRETDPGLPPLMSPTHPE